MKPVAGSECQSGFNPCSRDGQESFSLPLSLGNVAAEELKLHSFIGAWKIHGRMRVYRFRG